MSFFTENLFPVGDWRWAVTAALFFGVALAATLWPKIRSKRKAAVKAPPAEGRQNHRPRNETPAERLARDMREIRDCVSAFLAPEGPGPVESNRLRVLVERHRRLFGGEPRLYNIQMIDAIAARVFEMLRQWPHDDVVRTIEGEASAPQPGRAREEWGQIARLADRRPWLRYMAFDGDKRHGTVLRWDHPWWRENFPPDDSGHTVQQLSDEDLDRFGYTVSKEPPK